MVARYVSAALLPLLGSSGGLGETPLRIRGTIAAIDDASITVKEAAGATLRLSTGPQSSYAAVIPADLSAIRIASYIGSAVKGPIGHLVAVEIVLVPKSMRAGRDGYYPWDPLPDTSGIGAKGITQTTMTNGSVLAIAPMGDRASPAMSGGPVVSRRRSQSAGLLTVKLVGGKTVHIMVAQQAPVVEFVPTDRSSAKPGAPVIVWTRPGQFARLVAIGRGIVPPM